MKGSIHGRIRLALMLAVCVLWASTPLIAEICAAPAMHCQRHMQMPCCPPADSSQNCSAKLCPAQASARAVENQPVRHLVKARTAPAPIPPQRPAPRQPIRELTAGLHYSPSVFRLKDDLRI